MTTRKITKIICALAIASFLNAGNVLAHKGTGHDHRSIPVGWTFDQKVSEKILDFFHSFDHRFFFSRWKYKTGFFFIILNLLFKSSNLRQVAFYL